jgi:hypothetical protein
MARWIAGMRGDFVDPNLPKSANQAKQRRPTRRTTDATEAQAMIILAIDPGITGASRSISATPDRVAYSICRWSMARSTRTRCAT